MNLHGPLLASLLAAGGLSPAAPADFQTDWLAWQAKRLASLRKPQGWLSLVGLHWLAPGRNVVPGLPGAFERSGTKVTLQAQAADGWTVGGSPVTTRALADDQAEAPDRLVLGSRTVVVIERGDRVALRVWDSESPVRRDFKGIETFTPDPRWRVVARWEAYPAPRSLEVPSVIGVPSQEQAPGRAHFTLDGTEYTLEPTQDGDELFFVFKDRTAPKETYGAGRFLVAAAPRDGTVVLDFNRAYNPPCVFTTFATCPLPRPENVLPVRIEAGEKVWGHGH